MLVLGVDPGSRVTGFGLVEKNDHDVVCVHSGLIRPPDKAPFYQRIYQIFESMVEIMGQYHPHEMAIEDLFYAKNIQSSIKLGHARGAVLIAAVKCNIPIFEYSPLEIKKSVVGYGRADKEQVRSMIQVMLRIREALPLDTSDALAAAICHINWSRFESVKP